MKFQNQVV